jgi:hypothetical protein
MTPKLLLRPKTRAEVDYMTVASQLNLAVGREAIQ